MKTNRTNWIKLSEHETESFTHTLRYFTLLGRSWFGQYIVWKWCTIETLFCIRLCCYLNSTVALCKCPCIWWECEEFTHWLGGCLVYVSIMSYQVKVKIVLSRVLLRVEDTEFAKQLVYCILYCTVGHCLSLFIVLSFCVYCFANSVSSTRSKTPFRDIQKSVTPDINIGFHRIIIVPLFSISMVMKL